MGGSGQYRQDRVTIYLRATSTKNGRILKTVYTTKTILSQLVDVGVYRFVNFKRLLEVETGLSYNEPPEMCVTEAIEKAVHSLIIEGILEGVWALKNPEDRSSPAIRRYLEEKEEIAELAAFEEPLKPQRGPYRVGVNLALQKYSGDYANATIEPAIELQPAVQISSQVALALNFGRGTVSDQRFFRTTMSTITSRKPGPATKLKSSRTGPTTPRILPRTGRTT